MALLIDTDLLVDLERGKEAPAIERLLSDEQCAISVITISELLHGVSRATRARRAHRRAFVEHVLGGLQAIPITEPVARVHADIWSELVGAGKVIAAHDLWIAATALTHGLGMATRNVSHFERIPGVRVVAASA